MKSRNFKKRGTDVGRYHGETRQHVDPETASVHRGVQPRIFPLRSARFFSNQLCRRGGCDLARTHSVKYPLASKWLDYARGITDKQQIVVSGCQSGAGERSDATPRLTSGQAKSFRRPIL